MPSSLSDSPLTLVSFRNIWLIERDASNRFLVRALYDTVVGLRSDFVINSSP